MTIYVDRRNDVAFTRKALEEKVLEIITDCKAFHETYDEFFHMNIPTIQDYLDSNDSKAEDLETKIIDKEYEEIETIREAYIDWCCQVYLDWLIDDVLDEMELIDT